MKMEIESRSVAALVLMAFSIITVDSQNCGSCQLVGRFCYAFNSNKITNADAIAQCTAAGGQLPFFSTAQDLDDFATFATSAKLGESWLGYWNPNPHSADNPGIWKDQLGNDGTYYNWAPTQPDNYILVPGGEHCVQTYPGGHWNDISCAKTFQVVCQCQCPTPTGLNMHHTGGDPPVIHSVISLSCDPCFQLIGPATATCQYIGKSLVWDANVPSSYCSRIKCPALFTGGTGTYPADPYLSCTSYTYNCIANYIVDPRNVFSETYACSATGTWDKTFIPCTMITCADWNGLVNGKVAYSLNSVGLSRWPINTRAVFSCNLGYDLIGSTSSVCVSNNVWSQPLKPHCRQMTCADWNGLGNGTVRYSPNVPVANRWPFNTHADFSCNLGYDLIGSTSSICISNDNWSPPTKPYCRQMTCADWNGLGNGTVRYSPNAPVANRWPFNTHADFSCNLGYQLIGTPSSICISNDNWSPHTKPYCQRRICNASFFYDTTTGTPESSAPYYSLTQCQYECKTNFVSGWNNFSVYHCDANGHWKEPKLQLCKATCANISSFDNGTVTHLTYDDNNVYGRPIAGSNLSLSCVTGMALRTSGKRSIMAPPFATMEGPLVITCLNTQNWSSPLPYCAEPQPPPVCDPPLTTVSCNYKIEGDCPKWVLTCPFPLKPTPQPQPSPNSPLKKLVQVTYSMGCMAVVTILAVAMGIAFLNQDFDNSLEFVNFCTTMVLLLTYVCLMTVIDREGILVKFLNEGGCAVFAYILQFLFLSCFLLKVFKAIELLGIFGNILTNENMIRPFYIAFSVFWTSLFFTMGTYFLIGSAIGNEKTCFFNLNATVAAQIMIVSCAFMCWLAVIITESSGCAPFVSMRIGRQEPHSKLIFTDYIRVVMYVEVPITFFAWIANIYAQFTQQVGWYPIAFGLNIIAGVLALQCQFGAGLTLKNVFKKVKKAFKKRMGI